MGKLIPQSVVSETTSEAVLGNSAVSRSEVTYTYNIDGTTAYTGQALNPGQVLVFGTIQTKTSSSGSDLYGGSWTSDGYTMTQRYAWNTTEECHTSIYEITNRTYD